MALAAPAFLVGQSSAKGSVKLGPDTQEATYTPPFTGARTRPLADKKKEIVSVTDFGSVQSEAAEAFGRAFAAADEFGRELYIPPLDRGSNYKILGDLTLPHGIKMSGAGSGSGTSRVEPGSLLFFEEGGLMMTDSAGVTLENFRVKRVGSRPGAALDCASRGKGFARNLFYNVAITGSNDVGARFAGGWLMTWVNPYVRDCSIGLLVEEGAHATGMNSMTLVGGEIRACRDAGIVLDLCKQFNIVGTAIEGNFGIGIGIGRRASDINILGYFEANRGGHIMPYSHNGGSAGLAQCLVIQGGSYLLRGTSSTRPSLDTPAISLPKCRQFNMQDGVSMRGYGRTTVPIIHVRDVGDSNVATGAIGNISVDCPPDMALSNEAKYFGNETRRNFYVDAEASFSASPKWIKLPVWKGPDQRRNPSSTLTAVLHLDVSRISNALLRLRRRDRHGRLIGSEVRVSKPVALGYNSHSVTIPDSDATAYLEVAVSTAERGKAGEGVTIMSIEILTFENSMKNVWKPDR